MNIQQINCLNCAVKACTVFKNCDKSLLREINSRKEQIVFKKRQPIAANSEFSSGIYVLTSGVAKIFRRGPKGREFIFRLVKKGDHFGYRMNSEEAMQQLEVDAVEDCNVCFIDKEEFEKVVNESREVRQQLMIFYHSELSELLTRTCNLMEMTVRERIAETLLYVMEVYGNQAEGEHIRMSLSRQELADLAGTTKEQVSRTISDFKSKGFIKVSGKYLGMVDPIGLRTFAANSVS